MDKGFRIGKIHHTCVVFPHAIGGGAACHPHYWPLGALPSIMASRPRGDRTARTPKHPP